jgi:chaperonin GroES
MSKVHPLDDRVVVKPTEKEEVRPSGIIIPKTAQAKATEGIVIAIGEGRPLQDGERGKMSLKVGDRVIYARYGGTEVVVDDVKLVILREPDVLAIKE